MINWTYLIPSGPFLFCNYFTGELKSPLQKALISDKQIHLVGRLLSIRFEVWNSHAILSKEIQIKRRVFLAIGTYGQAPSLNH